MRYRKRLLSAGTLLVAGSLLTMGMSVSAGASSGPPSLKSLKGQTLVVTSWGGVWTQYEQKDLYTPFTKDTGIKVQVVVNGSDPSIPAMLEESTGNVSIDMVEPLNPAVMIGKGDNIPFPSWLLKVFAPDSESARTRRTTWMPATRRPSDCVQSSRHEEVPHDAG